MPSSNVLNRPPSRGATRWHGPQRLPVYRLRQVYRLLEPLRVQGLEEQTWSQTLVEGVARLLDCQVGVFCSHAMADTPGERMLGSEEPLASLSSSERRERAAWAAQAIRAELGQLSPFQAAGAAQAADHLIAQGRDHPSAGGLDRPAASWIVLADLQIWHCTTPSGVVFVADCVLPKRRVRRCATLHRCEGASAVGSADRKLLRLLVVEASRLYRSNMLDPHGQVVAKLSPRERQTMNLLLLGASEKQIAAILGLSAHTVHTYVKSLHRQFNVTSRSELLAQFINPGQPTRLPPENQQAIPPLPV